MFGSLSGIGTAKQKGPGLHLTYFQLYFDFVSITDFPTEVDTYVVDILWIYCGCIVKHLRLLFAAVNIAPNGLIPPFLLSHFCNDCKWHPQFESTLPLQERQNLKTILSNNKNADMAGSASRRVELNHTECRGPAVGDRHHLTKVLGCKCLIIIVIVLYLLSFIYHQIFNI